MGYSNLVDQLRGEPVGASISCQSPNSAAYDEDPWFFERYLAARDSDDQSAAAAIRVLPDEL